MDAGTIVALTRSETWCAAPTSTTVWTRAERISSPRRRMMRAFAVCRGPTMRQHLLPQRLTDRVLAGSRPAPREWLGGRILANAFAGLRPSSIDDPCTMSVSTSCEANAGNSMTGTSIASPDRGNGREASMRNRLDSRSVTARKKSIFTRLRCSATAQGRFVDHPRDVTDGFDSSDVPGVRQLEGQRKSRSPAGRADDFGSKRAPIAAQIEPRLCLCRKHRRQARRARSPAGVGPRFDAGSTSLLRRSDRWAPRFERDRSRPRIAPT